MTRISSVFNLLKRVGFAVLFLGTTLSYAEWYTDPRNPNWNWEATTDATLTADGLGGAFFAFTRINEFWLHIGHVNSRGNLTFLAGHSVLPYMLPIDSAVYAGTPMGATLIQSQPAGTVIAIAERIQNDLYSGLVISKYDSLGLTGFGSIGWNDEHYRLPPRQTLQPFGRFAVVGDENGGLHFCLRGWDGETYYNLLRSEGELVYPWPGLLQPNVGWARNIVEDGTGGVFMFMLPPPWVPQTIWGQRFNCEGQPQWGDSGRIILTTSTNISNESYLVRQGVVMIRDRFEIGPDDYRHTVHAIDSLGNHVWNSEGVELTCGSGESIRVFSDETGGFFVSFRSNEGTFRTCHYNGNADVIAEGVDGLYLYFPDQAGGGYTRRIDGYSWPADTLRIAHQRIDSDMNPRWPVPVLATDIYTTFLGAEATKDGFGGVLGLISASHGVALYHIDANGELGGIAETRTSDRVATEFVPFNAYPNPYNGYLTIEYSASSMRPLTISMYDILGRSVFSSGALVPNIGLNTLPLNTGSLPSGSYFVSIKPLNASENINSNTLRVLQIK